MTSLPSLNSAAAGGHAKWGDLNRAANSTASSREATCGSRDPWYNFDENQLFNIITFLAVITCGLLAVVAALRRAYKDRSLRKYRTRIDDRDNMADGSALCILEHENEEPFWPRLAGNKTKVRRWRSCNGKLSVCPRIGKRTVKQLIRRAAANARENCYNSCQNHGTS